MKKKIFVMVWVMAFALYAWAQIPERPSPPRLVNDFAGVLNSGEVSQMETLLAEFARQTSTQIVVVTVSNLQGYAPSEFAFKVGEKWGVGQKDKDNGLVVLLKPKQENSKGEIFIATGYGMEGVLPDGLLNGKIIDNEMIPYFKQNNYFAGIMGGLKIIMDISKGEYTAEQYQQSSSQKEGSLAPVIIILIMIFVVFPLLRGRRNRFYQPGKDIPFWIAMGMLSGRNRHGGMFDDFSSGRGGFGGFGGGSGGGFGGFGGGSFGGGGAGGSW
jgi:uncharacterized protein